MILVSTERAEPYTLAPSACSVDANDGWRNPGTGPLWRPISADAVFYPDDHAYNQAWGLIRGANLNFGIENFGTDLYQPTDSDPLVTVNPIGGALHADNLLRTNSITIRIPLTVGQSTHNDNNLDLYYPNENSAEGGTWYSIYQYNWVDKAARTAKALSCFRFTSWGLQGWGSPKTGSTAASITKVGTQYRSWELFEDGGKVHHPLTMNVGRGTSGGVPVLGQDMIWPAISRDSSWQNNQGPVPYGAWAAIKPSVSKGSISGLTECGSRMFDGLQRHGGVIVDFTGADLTLRVDQTFTTAQRTEAKNQFNLLYPHLRFINGVSQTTTYIGGNSNPLGPYCGHDRAFQG